MAVIPNKTIIFRKFDIWWPLLTSIFTWVKKWPKWLRMGSHRAFERRIARPSSFPSFLVRHFSPPTMAKVAETATWERVNPRPAGPLDFPPPAGGGGRLNAPPPWSRLLGAVEKTKGSVRKLAKNHFEIISVIFWLRSKLRSPGFKSPKFSKTVFRR